MPDSAMLRFVNYIRPAADRLPRDLGEQLREVPEQPAPRRAVRQTAAGVVDLNFRELRPRLRAADDTVHAGRTGQQVLLNQDRVPELRADLVSPRANVCPPRTRRRQRGVAARV